jgi:Raf kinase inhibitor-like YbhB/YbcL family protein
MGKIMRPGLIAALAVSALAAAPLNAQARLRLMSNDVHAGAKIADTHVFNAMGCMGKNISPEVHWTGAPAKTKSFALTVYDPDAPTGSGWWHWVVYNIPASARSLPQGAGDKAKNLLPAGAVIGNGDAGMAAYQGPCPAKGDKPHRYIFSLYALDTDHLDVPAGATAAYVGFNIHGHQLAKSTLTAMYGR